EAVFKIVLSRHVVHGTTFGAANSSAARSVRAKMATMRLLGLVACLGLVGCGADFEAPPRPDLFKQPYDFSATLEPRDRSLPAETPDMSVPSDLSVPFDIQTPLDLRVVVKDQSTIDANRIELGTGDHPDLRVAEPDLANADMN